LETWVLAIPDETTIFGRKVFRSMYGPKEGKNEWRIRHNYEPFALYGGMDGPELI
jgi:hypothetical protein